MENDYQMINRADSREFQMAFSRLMRNVYAWMTGGLLVTALTAWLVASSEVLLSAIFSAPAVPIVIVVAELALVWIFASRITTMSAKTAGLVFVFYSFLNGLTFSLIFYIYPIAIISQAFFITAGIFAAMTLVGMFTKVNLSSLGRFLIMLLIGVIIATVVNMFMHNTGFAVIINYVAVALFIGLTAYDTQQIKNMALECAGAGEEIGTKIAIWGSLELYLDFINLFLYILRILSDRR